MIGLLHFSNSCMAEGVVILMKETGIVLCNLFGSCQMTTLNNFSITEVSIAEEEFLDGNNIFNCRVCGIGRQLFLKISIVLYDSSCLHLVMVTVLKQQFLCLQIFGWTKVTTSQILFILWMNMINMLPQPSLGPKSPVALRARIFWRGYWFYSIIFIWMSIICAAHWLLLVVR